MTKTYNYSAVRQKNLFNSSIGTSSLSFDSFENEHDNPLPKNCFLRYYLQRAGENNFSIHTSYTVSFSGLNNVALTNLSTSWSLIYKRLPFERKFVELADVSSVSEKVGFEKILWFTGQKHHTFPAIDDANTGSKIADSFAIADHLDQTYSEGRPRLIPPGTRVFQKAFLTALEANQALLLPFILPAALPHVTEYSKPYFVSSREGFTGRKFEDIKPKGEEGLAAWGKLKQSFTTYNDWFEEEGKGVHYITGDVPVLADFYLGARLYFIRAVFGKDSQEWADIATWDGGRWARYLDHILAEYPL